MPSLANSQTSFEELSAGLTEHLPLLHARALRLSRNRVEAEDLVQDTAERALRFAHTFAAGTNARAWLLQILYSVFVTRCRKRRRERRAVEGLSVDPASWAGERPAEPGAPLARGLARALAGLPPRFAEVVGLVDLGEHSYREAADELGIPVGTVMSRLFRARQLLATTLSDAPLERAA